MMFKTVVAALVCACVSAFTSTRMPSRAQMSMKIDLAGSSAPLGFFDPLGFSKTDAATIAKYRDSELKHGRVAMLAVLGWLTQEKFHPLYDGKLSGNPLKAFSEVPPLGFVQIVIFIGLLEYTFAAAAKGKGYIPGDFYGISARIANKDDKAWVGFQTRELNNGRLAMFGILGEITHAAITGKGALEQLGI
ncbi:chlorophyll a/b-binding protein domain-containing protein [Ochromonadaceae sp. CCMP2298]|nr:chlorophyll a/b-binding protein domain-containing protein [Ochromonadaceae sp. CCMP2298]|mmetsp:Transcript_258/g.547  ORF Transcript_258/g.547 Transcript_258/m.547 type:complete len:191 (+) Transcript_258:93-665(+)